MKPSHFHQLFVLDLANNHQGDLAHAEHIIREAGAVVSNYRKNAALKFQFRHIPTFIHPDYVDRKDVKHIPRFVETALSFEDYEKLTKVIRETGLRTMATPFDEASVDQLLDLEIDIIKIASCSATDWPLLNRVAHAGKPVVLSTGGLSLQKIDSVVRYFQEHKLDFAVMHCVAIYPTPDDQLNLNQIDAFRSRYPGVPIGWSTHENQDATEPVQIAVAKGAELFERHIGVNTETYPLNSYSSTPDQLDRWFAAHTKVVAMCGADERPPASRAETASLRSLMRGVYARNSIPKGQELKREDVFFAMPIQEGQLASGSWREGMIADRDYALNVAIDESLADYEPSAEHQIKAIMEQAYSMLNEARIHLSERCGIELSHHYGLDRFREFGCLIVDVVNRTYCKKLIIQLPRQKHPYHCHEKKEETFQLLAGDLELGLNGKTITLEVGETVLIEPGMWHKFHTLHGAIFEEISTTHYNDDSFYEDERVAKLPRETRKTVVRKAQPL